MKRFNLFLIAILLMGGAVMAQGPRKGDRNVTPEAQAQRMTDKMVKEYSLNEAQTKQLLSANLELAKQMLANRQEAKEDKMQKREEMKAMRETREVQLKKILTDEQYSAYQKKQSEREKGMKGKGSPRHKRG